ncbi:MAG TPA: 4-alpha-glucanotransferase, partial [Thermodesulfovibrionales bacterium]|nr:4-alpha-glucanotransferase [Thermodesulfovibrionales bacterium]
KRMEKTVRVIITPVTCYLPSELQEGRAWGLSINLYSIRSGRNWGIGDFTDLKNIVGAVASLKGGFVGINPLHAIPNMIPFGISPYSPISRLYRNSIYLDLERVPEMKESEDARKRMLSEAFVAELDRLRKGEFIDYEKVMSMKQTMLKYAFDLFYEREYKGDTGRGTEFRRYLSQEGADLESFATYMAISEFMGREEESAEDCPDPKSLSSQIAGQKWPADYGDPSSSAVREFKRTRRKEILFYQYVQWIIDEQLRDVAREAENSGMTVGLYYDLAIGSVGGGADTWCCRDVIAGGIDVGAPPDDFNLNGQNWGFPPLIPEKLKETGYELFIQTIRKNMKYAGALRIDHALGMFRLFWIPRAMSPKEGAYVQCPSEDLLRIIALESVRSRTMVIAEDLGTIGDRARETLARFHMLSYRLFYFERNYPDASFVPPEEYPEMALCAVTTHDLPTLLGYWVGRDIEVKKLLGMYRDETQWREQVEERERDRELIIAALKSSNILPDDYPSDPAAITELSPELCLAVYRYLGLTPCKLVLASLDDITGTPDQQNMPGTVDEYPNWKRKATLNLEEIISDERITDLSRVLQIAMVRDRRERGE